MQMAGRWLWSRSVFCFVTIDQSIYYREAKKEETKTHIWNWSKRMIV